MLRKINFPRTVVLVIVFIFSFGNIRAQIEIPPHTFTFKVPEGASVYVGEKPGSTHYKSFTEKQPVYMQTANGTAVYMYNVNGKHNYRVSRPDGLTHTGVFTPNATNTQLVFTDEQPALHSPKEIDRNVNNLNGRNVADIFMNINEKGYLRLKRDATFQIIGLRNWQAIDSDINNYFIEPDFHYLVVNENGKPDNDVVTVNSTGLLRAVGAGTAIVLVTYDAMMCAHTTNVGNNGAAFFGALWPENTGVFVVSVDAETSDIKPNITVNENWNAEGSSKEVSYRVDAELDVFYYADDTDGYDYTFTPGNTVSVTLAQPTLGDNIISYNGFSTGGVTANANGSYTVRLVFGRNIVKLTSANGASEYQVMTAKPVTYTISNSSRPGENLQPGDEFSIVFNTLYHPCNKLAGIYNASAGIQYTGFDTDFPLILGPGQYSFASYAQEYKRSIPGDFPDDDFTLTNGTIKLNGYITDGYGAHRYITLEEGKGMNMNASAHTAFFGKLPDIYIRLKDKTDIQSIGTDKPVVCPNPFVDYITVDAINAGKAIIYDLSGKAMLNVNIRNGNNRIDTSELSKGIYLLKIGENVIRIMK